MALPHAQGRRANTPPPPPFPPASLCQGLRQPLHTHNCTPACLPAQPHPTPIRSPLLCGTCPPPPTGAAFIVARPPAAWRETLAAILTSAPYEQFEALLAALAARLNSGGEGQWARRHSGRHRGPAHGGSLVLQQAATLPACRVGLSCPASQRGAQPYPPQPMPACPHSTTATTPPPPPTGLAHAATLCYICAGDVDSAVRQWSKALAKGGQAPGVDALEVGAQRRAASPVYLAPHPPWTPTPLHDALALHRHHTAVAPPHPTHAHTQRDKPHTHTPHTLQALMEKAVVLGMGVNRQSASDALSGGRRCAAARLLSPFLPVGAALPAARLPQAPMPRPAPCIHATHAMRVPPPHPIPPPPTQT